MTRRNPLLQKSLPRLVVALLALLFIPFRFAVAKTAAAASSSSATTKKRTYGQGCSFPLENEQFTCEEGLLQDRLAIYRTYLQGCKEYFGHEDCTKEETRRLRDNAEKIQSMRNYTDTGYKKTRIPSKLFQLLQQHWNQHKQTNLTAEFYRFGKLPRNNYWIAPSYITNILIDGYDLMKQTVPIMKQVMEDWTGVEQRFTNLYGIRAYQNGTIITPHVDRYPLVISAILNIDQDVDEPWPLEILDRTGTAVNITMEPGDMVLYESHTTMHGRPFALNGYFYANLFVSFEPTGRTINPDDGSYVGTVFPKDGLPPFIIPGSPEDSLWRKEHPDGWIDNNPLSHPLANENEDDDNNKAVSKFSLGHLAASIGNVAKLRQIAETEPSLLHHHDENGWTPLHEAVWSGQQKAIEFLVEQAGADVNALTIQGKTPLSLILENPHPVKNHPFMTYLASHGAVTRDKL